MNVRMENWIDEGKFYIDNNNLDDFFEMIYRIEEDTKNPSIVINYDTIFRSLYLYSITSRKEEITTWLEESLFPTFNEVIQNKLRDTMKYAKYLKNK